MKKALNVIAWIGVALIAVVVIGQTMLLMERNQPAVNKAVKTVSQAADSAAEVVTDSVEAVAAAARK